MSSPSGDPIDFVGLAAALLQRADTLVPEWLPGGKRVGHEWVCANLSGGEGRSLSVNLTTGKWADFAGGGEDSGGDLVSLYAAIHEINNGQAAQRLMVDMGWERSQRSDPPPAKRQRDVQTSAPDDSPQGVQEAPAAVESRSRWRTIAPVPPRTPEPNSLRHFHHGEPSRVWRYEFEGEFYGYVLRFDKPDGRKEILPLTWCVDEQDPRHHHKWHWKQWDEPRPLYVAAGLLSGTPADVPVVMVEGEKCADAGHALLPAEFDFVSWPGGGKAWAKSRWGWVMGRTVYLWPDCDAKRTVLTKAEREAGVDPATKALKAADRQPGMQTMVALGQLLVAEFGCTVYMCRIPKPGDVADGWDLADAVAQGWTAEQVRDFIRGANVFVAPSDEARAHAVANSARPSAGAGTDEDPARAWRAHLLTSPNGALKAVRENAVLALDGLPELGIPGVPEVAGVVAFNEFTNDVVKLAPTPWGTPAGVWDEVDELEMGNWLTRTHWLPSMPRGTLEEAVAMVAKRHRIHPPRAELEALRGTWDGTKRLSTWLRRCCLKEEQWDDADPLQQYLARVGTWVLMAMCARVLPERRRGREVICGPGVKFDYMLILEGGQGVGKSTLARLLGGDYFADTGLVLGDKDSFQNLQGIWVYEWGELDSLTKAEVTKVKQFISSMKDRFRASFDRRAKDYPRQVIFIGTTNEDHYLVDPTGNRRMWPVRVTRAIDLDWLREHRAQLLAEALVYLDAGERFHPTPREQRELFEPQQQARQIENAIQAAVLRYLYDEEQKVGAHGVNGTLVNVVTATELLNSLGISPDKQTHVILRQVTAALRSAGWVRFRGTRGDRPWMFRRPEGEAGRAAGASEPSTTNRPAQGAPAEKGDDDCPL